jgi:hypothetical protein
MITIKIYRRVTDMRDGTFRPEVVADFGDATSLGFGPAQTTEAVASRWARLAAESASNATGSAIEKACGGAMRAANA